MNIKQNVSLKDFSGMKLGGQVKYVCEFNSKSELIEIMSWVKKQGLRFLAIGQGNNVFWKDEGFDGVLIINKTKGIEKSKLTNNEFSVTISGGEDWDQVVGNLTKQGLSGIEYLSLIPGTSAAAPVQNIGAYGKELADVFTKLEAYDTKNGQIITINKSQCNFGYRTSRFKSVDKDRFIIINITLKLIKKSPTGPYYKALEEYFGKNHISDVSIETIRKAVIDIRKAKLPDPKINPNNGSFFANPIVAHDHFESIQKAHQNLVYWKLDDGNVKLSAGRLMEIVGYKDKFDSFTGMSTWPKHTLTIVNKSASSTKDLLKFRDEIMGKVKNEFGITLKQEPELLPYN
ncbi:MAG TPA: UDP-N-acetylmuramate dehydrogenase [Candidatus Saccharimonadia bacterium]|nr:UDP-N-acetylmuramate dehydrogenase [Candidatus Saccharimonadia bacterium]